MLARHQQGRVVVEEGVRQVVRGLLVETEVVLLGMG